LKLETDTYLSIANPGEGLFKEKGSKFNAYAFPVSNEEEIKIILNNLHKEHFNARHICYAFRLGADKQIFRTHDAGEPTYTAGKPILGQIQSMDLTNVLIVVVRYFGGTLLGVGGLINAYKLAAADALQNVNIIEKTVDDRYEITFDFLQMNDVMKIMKEENLKQIARNFELKGNLTFAVRKNNSKKVFELFSKISNLEINYIGTK
jgi:uncharacterized YigZ family protein